MEFSTKAVDWAKGGASLAAVATDCLVLGLYADAALPALAQAVDRLSGGLLGRLQHSGELDGKLASTLLLHAVPGVAAARVLVVGLGKPDELGDAAYQQAAAAAARALLNARAEAALWALTPELPQGRELRWGVETTVRAARDARYALLDRHPQLKSKPASAANAPTLKTIALVVPRAADRAAQSAVATATAIANGTDLARDLGNLPGNLCTPTYLADVAKNLGVQFGLRVEVLGRKQIEALRMGAFLAVAQGTEQAPQFIVVHYQGGGVKQAPVVLVGKGITFDSGGISLKPGEGMDEMKFDMCGAASVLGTLAAVAAAGAKQNVIGIIPTCENMPSGRAVKPGDVVTSMSGQTIEVLNTDAEGRLILCDALTYAERFKPAAVIDVATLTGACVIALGHVHSGLFATDDTLANALQQAGRDALDTVWRMPLDDAYQEQLKSNFADLANIGGRPAGSVTAACFLSRFAANYRWAHLDIAGTAWKSGAQKGATGRPVGLLSRYLLSRGR